MKMIIYDKKTGKIVRVYYPQWQDNDYWGKKNFVEDSNLDEATYAQALFDDSINVDIVQDTANSNILTRSTTGKKYSALGGKYARYNSKLVTEPRIVDSR